MYSREQFFELKKNNGLDNSSMINLMINGNVHIDPWKVTFSENEILFMDLLAANGHVFYYSSSFRNNKGKLCFKRKTFKTVKGLINYISDLYATKTK